MTSKTSTRGTTTGSNIIRELRRELEDVHRRAFEAEQFLNYAPESEVRLHRRRVALSSRQAVMSDRPRIPMPYIEGGKSIWTPPTGLLSYEEAYRLPRGSQVRWTGDSREGGLREHTIVGWRPVLSPTDFYWIVRRGLG